MREKTQSSAFSRFRMGERDEREREEVERDLDTVGMGVCM